MALDALLIRKVRETNTYVRLLKIDGYTLYCDAHGYTCSWPTRKEAMVFFPYPSEWCEECMGACE